MDLNKINWKQLSINAGIPLVILVILALMPIYGWEYGVTLLSNFLLYVIITISWTIFSGITGYISLATAAFYGIGIYAAAIYYPATGDTLPLILLQVQPVLLSPLSSAR
jgi:ABC-type branched-subunit amino acid transport system permease subunit